MTIYKLLDSIDNRVYVGCTKALKQRLQHHRTPSSQAGTLLKNAILKNGWDNFKCEVLAVVETLEEAIYLEKYYISEYKSDEKEYGYNMNHGGTGAISERAQGIIKEQSIPVICITTGIEYTSMENAALDTNTYRTNICCACKGTRESAGKLPDGTKMKWKYKNSPIGQKE